MNQPLPNQPRPKALAALDALITQVEALVEARRLEVQRSTAAREDSRMASGHLRVAERRLAQLKGSRRALLEGEAGDGPSRRREPEGTGRPHRRKTPDEAGGG